MNPTERQQEAISHGAGNLLVAASAGSGKTEVLARRCLALITHPHHPCEIDRLLVLTFTRAAAAELRSRVAGMLRAHSAAESDAGRRDFLRRQEARIEAADIGTIDGWCGRLLRTHFADAGIDPGFGVLGEQDAVLMRDAVLDELFESIYRGETPLASAAKDWLRRHPQPSDDFLRDLVRRLGNAREHLVDPPAWQARMRAVLARSDAELRADAAEMLAARLHRELSFQAEQLAVVMAGRAAAPVREQLSTLGEQLEAWRARASRGAGLLELCAEIEAYKAPHLKRGQGPVGGVWKQVKERWLDRRLKRSFRPDVIGATLQRTPQISGLTRTLLDIEQEFCERLEAHKARRSVFEFADVLRRTLNLLGSRRPDGTFEPTRIARQCQERYAHVLVDEYQDTSPVQVAILELVTRPDPGNRFMVGDVKQSIYGFRQAEPRLFTRFVEQAQNGVRAGRVLPLSDNFRSHARLLDVLNGVFAHLFDPLLGGTSYGSAERLQARRPELANPHLDAVARVRVHILEDSNEDAGEGGEDCDDALTPERIDREAALAAEEIRALLASGVTIPHRVGTDQWELRALKLSDVVVLLRSAKVKAGRVASVLRAAGIPSQAAGRESITESQEVLDVRGVLTLLTNRRQDLPLAAYLRGPFVGLRDADLLRVRRSLERGSFHDCVLSCLDHGDDESLRERLRRAMQQLDEWAVAARQEGVASLVRRILRESGLPFFAQAQPGGAYRVAILHALASLAAEAEAGDSLGPAEFVAWLDALRERELAAPSAAPCAEDAVRVITIHAAKGLEFPVVFLLDAGAQLRRRRGSDPLYCDEQGGVGLRFFDFPSRTCWTSATHVLLKEEAQSVELEEELRLLYVALTRAREMLFVVGHAARKGAGLWDSIAERYAGQTPPLIDRLEACSQLEWTLMGLAAAGLAGTGGAGLATVESLPAEHVAQPKWGPPRAAGPDRTAPLDASDRAWIRQAHDALRTSVASEDALIPAVFSVSRYKQWARRESLAPGGIGVRAPQPPLQPATLDDSSTEASGLEVGRAYHLALQRIDLAALSSVQTISAALESLTSRGLMSGEDTALIQPEDLAWFGATETGRLLREHAAICRREVPFVYGLRLRDAGEPVIVRGVIDCLLETRDGLVLIDYKTDLVGGAADLAARLVGYRAQLRLYGAAAAGIAGRPVQRLSLVFLRSRRLEDVETSPITPDEWRAAVSNAALRETAI